jgi:hypothetical protein
MNEQTSIAVSARSDVAPLPLMTMGAHSHRVAADCPVLCLSGLLSGHVLNRLLSAIGGPGRDGHRPGTSQTFTRPGDSTTCAVSAQAGAHDGKSDTLIVTNARQDSNITNPLTGRDA